MSHSAILSYKNTMHEKFPLILVIGREPNNESTMSNNSIGNFNFDESPRCGFWNSAFHLFASPNSLNASQIKEIFRVNESCPILFSDASPIGIKNKITNKSKVRNQIPKEYFEHQLNAIFYNEEMLSRVKLILLSGLYNTAFSFFKNQLIEKAKKINIPTKQISFLYGSNLPLIKKELTNNEITIIKSVYEDFINRR